ncbi:ImmA/IrrE family metallo-endopeptidase [Virgibacillus sediminis]|uniref:ImmA/IrrE family metallo-endopeptidase n=1 Tax=Virgibacillus sediminis TaxID=202260 RepID=A0ABV7A667_9BACI
MTNQSTPLEDAIEELYLKLGVVDPDHPIDDVAERAGITLCYFKNPPFTMRGVINLDPRHSKEKQKEIFGHELCHALFHTGIQLIMPDAFRLKQEYQARNFAFHFCVPTFMLKDIKLPRHRNKAIYKISQIFEVTPVFAEERLIRYERQLIGAAFHQEWNKSIAIAEKNTSEYIHSSTNIMNQLY